MAVIAGVMKHVIQRYATDCYPACIAMVADISLTKAIRLVHPIRLKGSLYLTDDDRGVQVLRQLGFKVRKRLKLDLAKLNERAIIAVAVGDEGHVAVWDPIKKKILDPDPMGRWIPLSWYQEHLEYVLILS